MVRKMKMHQSSRFNDKTASSGNKKIYFFHILAVHVRTGDHGKCSRIKKKSTSNWPDFQIFLLQHSRPVACFSLELRFLCSLHQIVGTLSKDDDDGSEKVG